MCERSAQRAQLEPPTLTAGAGGSASPPAPDAVVARPQPDATGDSIGAVLIIDDEDILRETSQDVLSQFGYRTYGAASCAEAERTIQEHGAELDCVLLDLSMPGVSGPETFRRIREIKPDLKIIIVSGYDAQDGLRGFPPGATAGYLQKPFNLKALHAELQRIIHA